MNLNLNLWLWLLFLSILFWCVIEGEYYAVLSSGLKRGHRRLMRVLCRIHRLLLIRWLRGLILALKIFYALRQVRIRFFNFFVVHKFETDAIWLTMPNDGTERRGRPSASESPTDMARPRSLQ
jgi:hypothetical protein